VDHLRAVARAADAIVSRTESAFGGLRPFVGTAALT